MSPSPSLEVFSMPLGKRAAAELVGTFWLVFGGCGSAVLAAAFPERRHRPPRRVARLRAHGADDGVRDRPRLGLPPQSGGVGRALWSAGAFRRRKLVPYVIAQVVGRRSSAPAVLYVIASGAAGLRPGRGLRLERLRRALARRLLADGGARGRSRADLHVPVHHPGRDRRARAAGASRPSPSGSASR